MSPARVLRNTTFTELLATWGAHEASGRLKAQLEEELPPNERQSHPLTLAAKRLLESNDPAVQQMAGIEIALNFRAPVVLRILGLNPTGLCVEVEIDADHAPGLLTFDGRPLNVWARSLPNEEQAYIKTRTRNDVCVGGPLVTLANSLSTPPFVLMDGNHRAAAWLMHQNSEEAYSLRLGLVIVSTSLVPLLK